MNTKLIIQSGIANFDLKDFFEFENTSDLFSGAVLLITSKQVVMVLNKELGFHIQTFAAIISEIYNKSLDINDDKKVFEFGYQAFDMINASLVNSDSNCYILFNLSNIKEISINEFKMFEKFYLEYNDTINNVSHKLNKKIVGLNTSINKEDSFSNDLTEVYNYLKSIINKNKIDIENEKIILIDDNQKRNILYLEMKSLLEKFLVNVNKFKDSFSDIDYNILNKKINILSLMMEDYLKNCSLTKKREIYNYIDDIYLDIYSYMDKKSTKI